MIDGIKTFFKTKRYEHDLKRANFKLLLRTLCVLAIVACIFYKFVIKVNPVVTTNLLFTVFLYIIAIICVDRVKSIRKLTLISMGYVVFLHMPVFILYGAQTKSTSPMWFSGVIMIMIILLDRKDLWWMLLVAIYISAYIYTYVFIWNKTDPVIDDRLGFFLGFAISFIAIVATLSWVLIQNEKNYIKTSEEIEKSHEIEKKAGMAKSRFLANMSHEIRTPMNSIIGLSELVLKDEMDDASRNQVTVIKNSAYDLLEIIDDVLMYAKLDSGKMRLQCVDFSMNDIIKSVLDTLSANIKNEDIKVTIDIDHLIPKVINGDDIRIKSVIMRLVFISLSLTDNGRLMLSIHGEPDEENKKVKLICTVSDTGCGLAQADLDAIYGAYDTYDSRQNSNLKGIGLKFNICKEILKMMDGSLSVRSIEGVGLESSIEFTCDIVNPDPMISLEDASPKSVLIYVTDNRDLAAWKSYMEGFGLNPDYVSSYYDFEKSLTEDKHDFVFLPDGIYSQVANAISLNNLEDSVYVVCNLNNSFGDFDKCRIIRRPVSSIVISEVLNNRWKIDNYMSKAQNVEYDGSEANILVVDDNAVNLKVASGIFKSYRITIDTAKSGMEALNKMESKHYNLVLMDMVMPEMSGADTLKRMRMSGNKDMMEVPVVALTANTGGNIREEVLDEGFQEYLAKPIKTRYLTQIILQFLPSGMLKVVKQQKDDVKKENNPQNTEVKIPMDNTVDFEKGLKNMGSNEDAFFAVLNAFVKEGAVKITDVPKNFEEKDIKLFTTNVHGIKSASASIGAIRLSEMFKELEFAGKDGNTDLIASKLNDYLIEYSKILSLVKDYLNTKNRLEKTETVDKKIAASLKEAIKSMNISVLEEILENTPDGLDDFKTAFATYDFVKLNELCQNI